MSCGHNYYSKTFLKQLFQEIRNIKELLTDNPFMGAKEELLEHTGIDFRRIILQKHVKLIYFIEGEVIYLADIWDTRQDPDFLAENILQ